MNKKKKIAFIFTILNSMFLQAGTGLYRQQYIKSKSAAPEITITNNTPNDRTVMVAFGYYAKIKQTQRQRSMVYFCESKELRTVIKAGESCTFNGSTLRGQLDEKEFESLCGIKHVRTRKTNESRFHPTPIWHIHKENRTSKSIDITTDQTGSLGFRPSVELKEE